MPWTDDLTIGSNDEIWRRIAPSHVIRLPSGDYRPSSAAFRDSERAVSVHLAVLTTEADALDGYPEHSLAGLRVGAPRNLGYVINRDPTPIDPSHAVLLVPTEWSDGQEQRASRQLAIGCWWIRLRVPR